MVKAQHLPNQTPSILPLKLQGACVKRRGHTLIGPVDLTLGRDGFTIILGPNGAGKTTLLRLMHGLERPSAGRLDWNVPEVQARAHQAYVFQHPTLMRRTVVDNVAYPLVIHGAPRALARARATEALAQVGLSEHVTQRASALSGGTPKTGAGPRANPPARNPVFGRTLRQPRRGCHPRYRGDPEPRPCKRHADCDDHP